MPAVQAPCSACVMPSASVVSGPANWFLGKTGSRAVVLLLTACLGVVFPGIGANSSSLHVGSQMDTIIVLETIKKQEAKDQRERVSRSVETPLSASRLIQRSRSAKR